MPDKATEHFWVRIPGHWACIHCDERVLTADEPCKCGCEAFEGSGLGLLIVMGAAAFFTGMTLYFAGAYVWRLISG